MVNTGIDRISISVSNMAESVSFFRDVLEMSVVADQEIDPSAFRRLWRLPAGTTARATWLGNNEQNTLIELLEVTPNTGTSTREGAAMYDYGLLDIAFRAKGLVSIVEDLRRDDVGFRSKPVVYTAEWANVTVAEVVMIGPNALPIALIERLSEPKPAIRGRFGTMVDVAQFVPAMEPCAAFYTGVLGYTSVFDRDLPDGLIDEVVGLPPGTRSRMNFLVRPDATAPVVELLHTSAPGRSLAPVTGPTYFGLFSLAFQTADLLALLQHVGAAGLEVVSGPTTMELGPRGRIEAAVVRGPNQVLLQFFSK